MDKKTKKPGYSIIDWLEKISLNTSGIVILLMTMVVAYATLQRYFFSGVLPSIFYDEYAAYLLAISTWLALGASVKQDRFPRVMIFVDRLSAKGRKRFDAAANIGALVLLCVLTWQSAKLTLGSWQSGAVSHAAEVPYFLPQMFVPLGLFIGVVLIGHMTLHQIGILSGKKQRDKQA